MLRGRARKRQNAGHSSQVDPEELHQRLLALQESYGLDIKQSTNAFEQSITPYQTTTPDIPDVRDLHSKVVDSMRDIILVIIVMIIMSGYRGQLFGAAQCAFLFLSVDII